MTFAKYALFFTVALPAAINCSIMERRKQKGELDNLDPNMCYHKVYNKFRLSKDGSNDYQPWPVDPATKELCPTLEKTCCDPDRLKIQFDNFNRGYLQIREFFFVHSNITHSLRKHGIKPEPLKPSIFKCDDRARAIHDDQSSSTEEDPQKLLSQFLFQMEETLQNSRSFNYTMSKFYSGFVCSFCQSSIIKYFSETSFMNKDSNKDFFIRYSMESYRANLAMVLEYTQYLIGIAKAYSILNRLPQPEKFESNKDYTYSDDMVCYAEKMKECMKMNTVSELYEAADFCFSGLESGLDMAYMTKNGLDTMVSFYKDANEYFFLKFNDLAMFPKSSEKLVSKIEFTIPDLDTDLPWPSIAFDMADEGFSVTKHQYNEKHWFLSEIKVGIAVVFGLLAHMLC